MIWSSWHAGKQASKQTSKTLSELTIKQADRKVSSEVIELGSAVISISWGRKEFGLGQLSIFSFFFQENGFFLSIFFLNKTFEYTSYVRQDQKSFFVPILNNIGQKSTEIFNFSWSRKGRLVGQFTWVYSNESLDFGLNSSQ